LELVNADLMNQESITAAVKDTTMVIHTASPFEMDSEEKDE